MKKILTFATCMMLSFGVFAKEKLYLLNSESPNGTFNAQMIAYTEDLKEYYDVEYVQGRGCNKAGFTIQSILKNNHQVFYMWDGLRTADFLNNKNPLCGKIPTKDNFVHSVLKYPVFFTTPDGIAGEDMFKDGVKVGYNSNTNYRYLTELAQAHNVDWQLIRYENSKGVTLAVLNNEVDFGMINSVASYWNKSDKLKALYTLNPAGEDGIPPFQSVSSFRGADWSIADLFLIEGGDNKELRNIIAKILADPTSNVSTWYNATRGYNHTIDMDVDTAVSVSNDAINNWVE